MAKKQLYLYFHSPCFDGIASAVLTWDFLETEHNCVLKELVPVNYELRDNWLSKPLHKTSAVVDFLYHPKATFWADHHLTTFLSNSAKEDFERQGTDWKIYDRSSPSCASLLWEHLKTAFRYRTESYAELVRWATKIDSARYDSVEEAIFGDAPALRILRSLAHSDAEALSVKLTKWLRSYSLEEVANRPEVKTRFLKTTKLNKEALKRFRKSCQLVADKIVTFDLDSTGVLSNRYMPYYFYPEARYSLGVTRSESGITITAMRNPWLNFNSMYLGRIFERFGGGGHRRVGSIKVSKEHFSEVESIVSRILAELIQRDSTNGGHPHRDQEFQLL